jgi:hypothetical protein
LNVEHARKRAALRELRAQLSVANVAPADAKKLRGDCEALGAQCISQIHRDYSNWRKEEKVFFFFFFFSFFPSLPSFHFI